MEITVDMLLYALQKKEPSIQMIQGTRHIIISNVKRLSSLRETSLKKEVLYIAQGRIFSGSLEGSAAHFPDTYSPEAIAYLVLQTWQELLSWENHLCCAILEQAPYEQILQMGLSYLHPRYMLINRNFVPIYASPASKKGNALSSSSDPSSQLPLSSSDTLLLRKDFHDAAQKTVPFYYENNPNEFCYCQNLFIDEQYFARLVMTMEEGETSLVPGEEELFALFAKHIQQLFQNQTKLLFPTPSDILQQICLSLLAGEPILPQQLTESLAQANWQPEDIYVLTEIQFFSSTGWQAQLATTIPYLTHKLEKEWEQACILPLENRVLCLINLSRTQPNASDTAAFSACCRRLAIFVRDHICKAGVSSLFRQFSHFSAAAKEAHTALLLGQEMDPSYWYYLYDRYRLDHMLQILRRELSPKLCLPPALQTLLAYDSAHHTELVPTLRAYLSCGLNMSEAAGRLYIHRTSFCRRMDRIRELTALDLADPDTILLLSLALRLME